MSAGAGENVMGVLADSSGAPRSGNSDSRNSGFNGTLENGSKYSSGIAFPEAKYYDLYTSMNQSSNDDSLSATACSGGICYGHGLSETAGWYQDYSVFVSQTMPWVLRGGGCSSSPPIAGVFYAGHNYGYTDSNVASRAVLVPGA